MMAQPSCGSASKRSSASFISRTRLEFNAFSACGRLSLITPILSPEASVCISTMIVS